MLVKLELYGLSCGACVKAVRKALENVGAKVIEISTREALVEFDDDTKKLIEAIEEAGYKAKVK